MQASDHAPAIGDADPIYLGLVTSALSLAALLYFFRHQEILLYGDATAHIHIARRVFDSRTPSPMELGTVWLPLPHLLIIPFIIPPALWSSGWGASIPSMAAYVVGTLGVFRLLRGALLPQGAPPVLPPAQARAARVAAWGAALVYALNPNLLYLQATAMTEPLYLALFLWAAVFFSEFVQASRTPGSGAEERRRLALTRCAWVLLAAMLTRYDGWFAAALFTMAAFLVMWREVASKPARASGGGVGWWRSPLRPMLTRFLLIVAIAPVLWLAYNAIGWGNPLEFATGPYSATAIEARASRPGGWHHPGWHAPRTAAIYFLKAAKLNLAGGEPQREPEHARTWRLENLWLPLALLGAVLLLLFAPALWPWLMLWAPWPFYALSMAWGGVPLFVPVWWPYSYYNLRYGLQLLPAFAVFAAAAVFFVGRSRLRILAIAATLFAVLVGASYAVAWRARPVLLREAHVNNTRRIGLDRALAAELRRLPPQATVLMYTASHAAALQFAEFPLRRTINETNNRLWRAALAQPGASTDYIIAFENAEDPVWRAVQQHAGELQLLEIITALDQPRTAIYRRRPH